MTLSQGLLPAILVLSMHMPHADAAEAGGRVIRQGTVVRLDDGHSLAIERVERHDDGRMSARLALMPEPGREWTATAEYAPGQWLVAGAQCYQVVRLEPSHERERATVLLKGPNSGSPCVDAAASIPVFAGDGGTRIGASRIAVQALDAADGSLEWIHWPAEFTLASAPPAQVRRQRIALGATVQADGRGYWLARVHAAAQGRPAFAEFEAAVR